MHSAPPAPWLLHCQDPGIVGYGQPGQLAVQVDVDPTLVDMVSFMVARMDGHERWPFIHYSVLVEPSNNGTVFGTIPGLEAGGEYRFMARAHSRNQTISDYIFWSDVTHKEDPCMAAAVGASSVAVETAATTVAGAVGSTDTMWLEVFRHNGNHHRGTPGPTNNITLPDYIEARNVGDLGGVFYNEGEVVRDAWDTNSSFTRYCVEVQVVELHNVTTPTYQTNDKEAGGFPTTSQFADFSSCASGKCSCMTYDDRRFRQPQAQLEAECPGCSTNQCQCQCSAERLAESAKYIGMTPAVTSVANSQVVVDGHWYSLPPAGFCAPGARIGDAGCTYRLSPLSHSISLGKLYNKGVFSWRPWRRSSQFVKIARAAFDEIGAEPCGGSTGLIREQLVV